MIRKLDEGECNDDKKSKDNATYIGKLKDDFKKPENGMKKLEKTRKIIDYSVCLKLAMNCFDEEDKGKSNG